MCRRIGEQEIGTEGVVAPDNGGFSEALEDLTSTE